ncbi:MAG: TlpA disulfide reductase family protein [Fimbriimonadaceae bacterium]
MDKSIRAAWIIALLLGCFGCAGEERVVAPDIVFETLTLPVKTTKLSDHKGKVVLLDFWATWCGPCVYSMPLIEQVHQKYKGKGLVVIGVTDEGRFLVESFLKQFPVTYDILLDTNKTSHGDYGLEKIPMVYLIDTEGKIAYSHQGATEDTVELEAEIEKLLPR